jgi:hypothetical protein
VSLFALFVLDIVAPLPVEPLFAKLDLPAARYEVCIFIIPHWDSAPGTACLVFLPRPTIGGAHDALVSVARLLWLFPIVVIEFHA